MNVPNSVVESEIEVIIDEGLTPVLYANYSLHSDGTNTWIYFAYSHSTHEITIIPEFLPPTMFLASALGVLSVLMLRNRRRKNSHV
jgi:hypothetical protein